MCIYLPQHYGESDDEETAVKLAAVPRSEEVATVLVADDEPIVRMWVIDVLDDIGYRSEVGGVTGMEGMPHAAGPG